MYKTLQFRKSEQISILLQPGKQQYYCFFNKKIDVKIKL